MEVKRYKIIPIEGWKDFSRHVEVADFLYDSLIPMVNRKQLEYLNLFVGCGVFEDKCDNSIFILFDDSKKKERIVEIRTSESQLLNPIQEPSFLIATIAELIDEFRLEKISID